MGFTSGGYTTQRGLGRAQFRKLETVASRLSNRDHFYGNRFFQPSGLSPTACNPTRIDGKCGDHFLQADFTGVSARVMLLLRTPTRHSRSTVFQITFV